MKHTLTIFGKHGCKGSYTTMTKYKIHANQISRIAISNDLRKRRVRSIQPKFQPVRPGKVVHLKRWTRFFETFPVGPNRSIEFWTEISGNFGWMDRARSVVIWRGTGSWRYPSGSYVKYYCGTICDALHEVLTEIIFLPVRENFMFWVESHL